MVKRKHHKNRFGGKIAIILLVLAIISVIVLGRMFLGGSSHILTETNPGKNALSQQVTTTTTTVSTTRLQETRTQTTKAPETTTRKETSQTERVRLEEIGNSGVEFETLDEASEYAEKVITTPQTLSELRKKGYSGYRIRSIRWSDNTVTYTIDWV